MPRSHLLYKIQLLLFVLISISAHAQDYNQLIKQKEALIKESNYLNNSLKEIQINQQNTVEELKVVNKKISIQENILKTIELELDYLENENKKLKTQLFKLDKELNTIKEKYAQLVRHTQISLTNYTPILFLASSNSFNQLLRRVEYFREIEADRKKKYTNIIRITAEIQEKRVALSQKKVVKIELLQDRMEEKKGMKEVQELRTQTIKALRNKEDSLLNEILIKNQEKEKITAEITAILNQEKEEKNKLTPELKLISANFYSNKGRLPWPTFTGTVVTRFGQAPHPVLSEITIMNNGIELKTENAKVRSVFDGEVSKIIILPNGLKVIIIRHGDYFTVYSNLQDVTVQKGQQVKTKDNIGMLYSVQNKKQNILGFQIWKAKEKLNPIQWLSSY